MYELPGYIQSRLKPRIDIVAPPWALQEQILRLKCPMVDDQLLADVFKLLKSGSNRGATTARATCSHSRSMPRS